MNFLLNSRYFLGHFHTEHFQLLSGIKFTLRPRLYGAIYFSIIFLTTAVAFVTANIKKMNERYKERKFHQNITVNLNEQQLQFNNVKNNFPLFNGFQIALLVGFVLACNFTFWFLNYTFKDSEYFYKQFLFKQFTLAFIYKIVVPLIYLIQKKMMRKYLWKYVTNYLGAAVVAPAVVALAMPAIEIIDCNS